jgi:hypothetical protein
MNQKILPLGEPIIKCYQYDAFPLSILAVDDDYLPWFYSNYIQIFCNKSYFQVDMPFFKRKPWYYNLYIPDNKTDFQKKDNILIEFFGSFQAFSSPWIDFEAISWDMIGKSGIDIINLIKMHIDNNYYFYGYVDEFYVKDRYIYNKFHGPHDILIYGYDNINEKFSILGYNDSGALLSSEMNFSDFSIAFEHNNFDKDLYFWSDTLYFLKKNEKTEYALNFRLIYQSLSDYLFSRNSSEHYLRYCGSIETFVYGISTYDIVIEYFNLLLDDQARFFDIRITSFLWEHKKCMKSRFEYIIHNFNYECFNSPYLKYAELEKESKIIHNLMIKLRLTKDKKIITRIISVLNSMRQEELEVLNLLLGNFA